MVVPTTPMTLTRDDPLFGVLDETQVGLDPLSGRPEIAKEVLEEMRRYMVANTGEDRAIKMDRLRSTVREAESDPRAQRTVLRLEAPPIVTSDLNRGKGLVFDYGDKSQKKVSFELNDKPEKLMAGAFKAFKPQFVSSDPILEIGHSDASNVASVQRSYSDSPTVFQIGSIEPGSSGTITRKQYVRRRPPKGIRKAAALALMDQSQEDVEDGREGKQEVGSKKRKKVESGTGGRSTPKAQCLTTIPSEGLSNAQ